jgi:hypothetical protein
MNKSKWGELCSWFSSLWVPLSGHLPEDVVWTMTKPSDEICITCVSPSPLTQRLVLLLKPQGQDGMWLRVTTHDTDHVDMIKKSLRVSKIMCTGFSSRSRKIIMYTWKICHVKSRKIIMCTWKIYHVKQWNIFLIHCHYSVEGISSCPVCPSSPRM